MEDTKAYECILEEMRRLKENNDNLIIVIEKQIALTARQEALINNLLETIHTITSINMVH
jgi:hypothetical protein